MLSVKLASRKVIFSLLYFSPAFLHPNADLLQSFTRKHRREMDVVLAMFWGSELLPNLCLFRLKLTTWCSLSSAELRMQKGLEEGIGKKGREPQIRSEEEVNKSVWSTGKTLLFLCWLVFNHSVFYFQIPLEKKKNIVLLYVPEWTCVVLHCPWSKAVSEQASGWFLDSCFSLFYLRHRSIYL